MSEEGGNGGEEGGHGRDSLVDGAREESFLHVY
jgi:hypothetical protein